MGRGNVPLSDTAEDAVDVRTIPDTKHPSHCTEPRGSTTARYFLPPSATLSQYRPSRPAALTPAMLSSHLRLRLPNSLLPSESSNQKYKRTSLSSHACHILRTSIVLNDQLYSVWPAVSTTKLQTRQFSAASCHSPRRPRYHPHCTQTT